MSKSNAYVADLLRRYAAALALQGANRFKIRAYKRAAQTIEWLEDDVAELVARNKDLTELPGIGKAINDVVLEIVQNKKLDRLERSLTDLTPTLAELVAKPALDPKKVQRIYRKLGISSLEELKKSLEDGRIAEALGNRFAYHVRQGLDERPRSLLYSVGPLAEKIKAYLYSIPGVSKVSAAGSLRRKPDTVGDLNFLVMGERPASVFKRFGNLSAVLSADPRSDFEAEFTLSSGLRVTLRWSPLEEWGFALILATGSFSHVKELEARAATRGFTFTCEGLASKQISLADEKSVYAGLGLPLIPPELREGRGELSSGRAKKLPQLIEVGDLRGDLHMHTTASDGANTIAEMAAAAKARGYEYIAITDHSQSLKITNGLSEERLLEQIRAIDKINGRLKGFRVLKSAEVDILPDGRLDYSNAVLKELDFTICSIHSRFNLSKLVQTERILRAMDNRYFTILGHATGRLLLKRAGYEIDMDRVIEHAKARGCCFEINSSPDRLDLSDEHAKLAKDGGVMIAVNTDAHSVAELEFISAGINQARRGWLEARDVLNARPLAQLVNLFHL